MNISSHFYSKIEGFPSLDDESIELATSRNNEKEINTKRLLIINGHPDKESLCASLAEKYKIGADKSGAECTIINLANLEFSPVLKYGYRKRTAYNLTCKKCGI